MRDLRHPPLQRRRPPKFDEVYDVVVVGSGIAGTMAALVAAKNGAKTLLIEKLNRLGGTSRYSGLDFACVGSVRCV